LGRLLRILTTAKEYKGYVRKADIGEIVETMGGCDLDDAGIMDLGGKYIVVSTDGITEELVKSDPWFAGYYSVLVNVNDVVVKGGRPLGYVNVISSPNRENRLAIARGIQAGLAKFNLKLLKGHTHPDSSCESVTSAVIGEAKRVARATTAREGDLLAMVIDLTGSFGVKGWVKCFDSTVNKTKREIGFMVDAIIGVIEAGGVTASRDISAPGTLGTLAMLCEASSVGADIDLALIPRPKASPLEEWLITYPAMGYLFGVESEETLAPLERAGFAVRLVGKFTSGKKIVARLGGESGIFLDMSKESLFGLRRA
jgi:selenophosphate synthetase-related protein